MRISDWSSDVCSSDLAGADVAVFPFVAAGGRDAVANLHLARGLRVVETPRAATVLLVIGRLTRALLEPLLRIHDQMAAPRVTAHWVLDDGPDPLMVAALTTALRLPAGDAMAVRSEIGRAHD